MWSNFEQSTVEDNTISNAYSARGIFKIRSEKDVEKSPQVQAAVQNGRMVIAIDRSIVLLEDEIGNKCSFLSFNADLDVVAVSQSGNLIVCGLSDGEIHGIFIKGIPVFNVSINMDDVHMTGRTFASVQQLGQHFYFTCTNGSVYKLSEINETPMQNYMQQSSIVGNDTVLNEDTLLEHTVSLERITIGRGKNEVDTAVLLQLYNEQMLLFGGAHNVLHFTNVADKGTDVKLQIPERFGGIKNVFYLENFLLLLTHSGHLLEACMYTKIVQLPQIENEQGEERLLIDEMIVMECSDESIELLVLTKYAADQDRLMKIIEYPSFKCNSELEVMEHTWLVQQPKYAVNLYYVNGINLNVKNYPTEIEMTLVSETQPGDRFKKLIAKGRWEEAESFGQQFELCLQPLYEAQAKRLMLQLSQSNDANMQEQEQKFSSLLEFLQKVENVNFFRNNRMFVMPSRHMLKRFLNEVLKHFDAENEKDESHILEIEEQLHRLDTLSIIDPYECNMEWQKFVYNENLLKTITTLFQSDMSIAGLIWKRHAGAFLGQVTENDLQHLLTMMPDNIEPFQIIIWLRHFVPIINNTHPSLMPHVTNWSIEHTRNLQYAKHNWPEIGLEFATKVLEVFEEVDFLLTELTRQHERNIRKLRDLVNALQDLSVLKSSYNLTLTLNNYLQDSIDETAFCILQHVQLDKLKSLVNDFLYPIYQEKGKLPVAAISRYIRQLVANRHAMSMWLERAVVCIELLHNEDDSMESALLVLQNSPVPWPDSVASLVKLRNSTHPLAVKIGTEYEIQVIKIMKVKYGWPADSVLDARNLNLFVFRIVALDLPDMVDDIRTLTQTAPEVASSANFNYCYQLARLGRIDESYAHYKWLRDNYRQSQQTQQILQTLQDMLEITAVPRSQQLIVEQDNLLEFLQLITPTDCEYAKQRLRTIRARFALMRKFQLTVPSASALVAMEHRQKLLGEGLENIIQRSQATLMVCKFMFSECKDLCQALNLPLVNGVRQLAQRLGCLSLSCYLSYNVLETIDCTADLQQEFVDLALLLLVQQIDVCRSKAKYTPDQDWLALPLAIELLVQASLQPKKLAGEIMDMLKYLHVVQNAYALQAIEMYYDQANERELNERICRTLQAAEIEVANTTLSFSSVHNNVNELSKTETDKNKQQQNAFAIFDAKIPSPTKRVSGKEQWNIVKFVCRTLLLMVLEAESSNDLFKKLRKMVLNNFQTSANIDEVREDFFMSLETLIKSKVCDTWYIVAQYLLEYQRQNDCKILNVDFVTLNMNRILRLLIGQKDVNFIDLFAMVLGESYAEESLEKLRRHLKTDQQKINFLLLLEMYKWHKHEEDEVIDIRNTRIKYYYYLELCKQEPNIKGKFNAEIDSIELLFKQCSNYKFTPQLLQRMSRDFVLDYQQLLVTQILSILTIQEPQHEIKLDAFGEEELVMLSNAEDMLKSCQPYLSEIQGTELLIQKLKNFITKINFYFYELYLCVIELLSFLDAAPKELQIWRRILQFLKHKMVKRRRSRPGQVEIDAWLAANKEINTPYIARFRLPFKPLVESPLTKILENELSVENCESWFPLIQMHSDLMDVKDASNIRDYFCLTVVKNFLAEVKTDSKREVWHLKPTNNAVLKAVLRVVKHVTSHSKAFALLYFVSNYAPDGADLVEASYECYKYALENEALITEDKYHEIVGKIKRRYPSLKTQHLLYVYGLNDERLLRLVENPTELIYALYHHDAVVKSSKLDINKVAREIAELHDLNIERIQYQLLQKWLAISMEMTVDGTVMDETFFDEQNMSLMGTGSANGSSTDDDSNGNPADNVLRAFHILNSWPKMETLQFLVGNTHPVRCSVTAAKQLPMYECFSKLNDGSKEFMNILEQRKYVTIKCVHELQRIGYNASLDKFMTCNKFNILKEMWQRKPNQKALEIMANISLGFDIYASRIWNCILHRMAKFNMVRQLNALVELVSTKPQLLNTEGLCEAWECVLMQAFKTANQARSFAQDEILHKALFRMQSSPVVHKLNLLAFTEQCIRLERPYLAAVPLALCRKPNDIEEIKKLINSRKSDKLRKEILELEDAGILPTIINYALKVLQL